MKKYGLVLEGGAMRGMFTAGVIDIFLENDISFDGTIGVSAGATFGCNIKSKQIGRTIRYNKRFAGDKRYCSFSSLIKTGDLYGADFCYNQIPNVLDPFDRKNFTENPMEFYVVASDAERGTPIYKKLTDGGKKDLEWMRASASMPLVSKPVKVDGFTLLDGGMTDSIPLKFFQSIGYQKNIVVLTQPKDFVKKKSNSIFLMKFFLRKYPLLLAAMESRHVIYNEETKYVFSEEEKENVLVICPPEKLGISRTEDNPDELERVYQLGRKITLDKLEEIKKFLADK